jgi:RNA-binding protein
LQRLGLILHVTPSRNIVARIENMPKIGEIVVDENLRSVGKVFDIIGPVSSPYASITPAVRNVGSLINKTVYSIPSKRRREKKGYER